MPDDPLGCATAVPRVSESSAGSSLLHSAFHGTLLRTYLLPAVIVLVVLAIMLPTSLASAQQKGEKPTVEDGKVNGADGVHLYYRKLGHGKDFVMFLHGGPGLSINDGGYIMEPLGTKHTLIMYDQRGGGRSDLLTDHPELLTLENDIRDLEAIRQHFGIDKMALVGLSWGSGLAAHYAAAHPERVSRIVFLDPMPITIKYAQERGAKLNSLLSPQDASRMKEIEKEADGADDEKIKSICREQMRISSKSYLVDPKRYDQSPWDLCDESAAAIRNVAVVFKAVVTPLGDFDFRPVIAKLNMPALVIEGDKTNVPLDATREWAKKPADARLDLVPNAGHATFVDRPEAVLEEIETFLAGVWPANAKKLKDSD